MFKNQFFIASAICSGLAIIALSGCSQGLGSPPTTVAQDAQSAQAVVDPDLFEGLGSHRFQVTVDSARARILFDQGLNFLYAFNHDEAITSFQKAADIEPNFAMAWWGIATAHGPHINNPVVPDERSKAALLAISRAEAGLSRATDIEKQLIGAAKLRYSANPKADRQRLDRRYAAAMKRIWKRFKSHPDVGALYAEALMDLRPWDLWTSSGKPQPGTLEVLQTLEAVLKIDPKHPLANHLYIHAVEASPEPSKGIAAANQLRNLQPGLGHMVHMPSHIDVRTGNWEGAIRANEAAIIADDRYRQRRPLQGFYNVYMLHNRHMLAFAAMMRGQADLAIQTIDQMVAGMPQQWARENAIIVDGIYAMPAEVRVRFGRWDEVLNLPEPPEQAPFARALLHAAQATALLAKGDIPAALEAEKLFETAAKRISPEAFFGNNSARDLVAVQRGLLRGEILFSQEKSEQAFKVLREAVRLEDQLRYDEPPDWILPVRHALGAVLLKSGKASEAETVYRDDLKRWPENGWSLFGLEQALRMQQKLEEAEQVQKRYKAIWKDADTEIHSSCLCQQKLK